MVTDVDLHNHAVQTYRMLDRLIEEQRIPYPLRPRVEDTSRVKTAWPNDMYL